MTENTQGNARASGRAALDAEQQGRINRFALCVPLCVSVYSLSALFWFHLRRDAIEVRSSLQTLYASIYGWFGFSACIVFFLLLLIWTSIWFFAGRVDRPVSRLLRLVSVAVMLGVFLSLGKTAADGPTQGELGFYLAQRLVAAIGYPVSWLFVFLGTVASLLLATDFFFSESFEKALGRVAMTKAPDPARDRGVEAAVTEHLKGLAQVAPARPPAPSVDAVDLAAALAEAAEADATDDAAAGMPAPPAAGQPPEPATAAEPRRYGRRRSYFERRYDDAPAETWVPAAPESQEIDNPESRAESGGPAANDADGAPDRERVAARFRAADVEDAIDEDADVEDAIDEDAVDEEGDAPITLSGAAEDSDEATGDSPRGAGLRAAADVDDSDLEEDGTAAEQAAELDDDVGADDADEDDADEDDADEDDADEDDGNEEGVGDAEWSAPEAETLFAIPRPEAPPEPVAEPAAPIDATPAPTRQRGLFGPAFDEELLAEARAIVLASNRPTAALLRRRLRIGYEEACEVLAELSARGIVDLTGEP